jgi:Fe-S-cluster containining protein
VDLHFECTQCGKCCRDLKLPLTVSEAREWLRDGHAVQLLCDAVPWPREPEAADLKAAHRRRRSFAAMSGSMPTRVVIILAANLAGACPNLQPDMRCGIYERRPLVCRIYPAEINPFTALDPGNKGCPPEAWTVDHPLMLRDGRLVDDVIRRDIQLSRDTDANDAAVKRRLCAALNVEWAALADEGFVVYSPARLVLLAALDRAITDIDVALNDAPWQFASNRADTVDSLVDRGAVGERVSAGVHPSFEYIGFRPASG